jgi:hydrogenase maturation protein HypF
MAVRHGINGWVANTGSGVEIVAQAEEGALDHFVTDLEAPPPLAVIQRLDRQAVDAPITHTDFTIRKSEEAGSEPGPLPPDAEICPACLVELFNKDDRRHHYPFTNCTDCGPRYTVINNIPYDRPCTTMAGFTLCSQCAVEYKDPLDRRFHAQTNCCPDCGPHYRLYDSTGKPVVGVGRDYEAITGAADLLADGNTVAVKGIGHDFNDKVACTAGTGVSGVFGTFVDDIERLR